MPLELAWRDAPSLLASALLAALLAAVLVARRREARLRAAQAELRASQERLRLALDAASDILWDWDLRTDRIFHPRFAQVYGWPEAEVPRTGGELFPYFHPDDAPKVAAAVDAVFRGAREDLEIEHRVRTASGEYLWMLGRARVVARGPNGEALRLVGTCTDVTERRRMLERLQLSDRMAAVGTLAAGVAHEINNPLGFVNANVAYALEALAQLAAPGAAPRPEVVARVVEECRVALGEAASGASRVRRIVQDLKALSRADDDRRVAVDVGRALDAALHIAGSDLRHRARVITRLTPVPPVLGDEGRLTQVFLNILLNAAQAIPEGRLEWNEVDILLGAEGDRVVLAVRDTGCGIAPEHLGRIFDPFFTTKPVGIGTGLGLAISHGIVTAHGGDIEVESAPGRGSRFRISLPAAPDAALRAPQAPDAAPAPEHAARSARVLVVDDEPMFCHAMVRMIGSEHDVVALGDAREALRRIEAGERFDAIFADLVMPGMNGVEFHDALARLAPDLASRMRVVTGGAFTPGGAEFLARMSGRVLEKPVVPADVRAALAAALGGERPIAEA
jgi:PAS domain S-box-containing protein